MRSFFYIFARRLLIPCGALTSSTVIAGSYSNINDHKSSTTLKSVSHSFSRLWMGGKGQLIVVLGFNFMNI